jgi:hypothetical protein
VYTGFWWGDLKERDYFKDSGAGERILKRILKKRDGTINCSDLAQDRDKWRALVNAVMNTRVPLNAGNFSTT